jgi:hypothetical protein
VGTRSVDLDFFAPSQIGTTYLFSFGVIPAIPGYTAASGRFVLSLNDGAGFTIDSAIVTFYDPALAFLGQDAGQITQTSAVPEVSTWAMMILGFFSLGFAAHRQKKSTLGRA